MEPLIISPKTKILQLLDTYPQLEEALIGYVPVFKKLKNPVLRNTVAKITTLQQAAAIGNVKAEDLINMLRKAVGQDTMVLADDTHFHTVQPAWFDKAKVVKSLDIREMLNAGEQPVNLVIADLKQAGADGIYEVIAPFAPAPLIDKALSLGFDHWLHKEAEELYHVYFRESVK